MCDLIEHSRTTKTPLGILLLDQEKAFDKVSQDFLWKVMEKMGFQETFINWIRSLYHGASSQIRIGDELSEKINLERGVRQGDPISPLLFTLCMEPLIQAIQTDPLINGYTANEVSFKTSAYADDLTVFISSGSDALRVEYWMDTFSKASGATFNQNKSEAIFHLFSAPVTRFTVLDSLLSGRSLLFQAQPQRCLVTADNKVQKQNLGLV